MGIANYEVIECSASNFYQMVCYSLNYRWARDV